MIFPSFRSWMEALKLSLPAYLGVMVFPFFGWAGLAFVLLLLGATGFQTDVTAFVLTIAALVSFAIGLVFHALLKLVWWGMLKLLWNHPPRWLSPAAGFKATLHSFIILAVATAPLAALFLLLSLAGVNIEDWPEQAIPDSGEIFATFVMRFYWLWLLSAAYLIHWFPTKSPVDEQGKEIFIRK